MTTTNNKSAAMDFNELKETAIRHIQEIGHKNWTDFNVHDPGVTILESLCFALSDLSYKTGFNVVDLLTKSGESTPTLGDSLYSPEEILSNNPIGIDEYRKMILENVPGLRNVWMKPRSIDFDIPDEYSEVFKDETLKISIRGYYDVFVEPECREVIVWTILSDDELCKELGLYKDGEELEDRILRVTPEAYEEWIKGYIMDMLLEHRNINENFLDITVMKPVDVKLQVEISTETDVNYEETISEIYEKVEKYVSPKVRLYTIQELVEKGKRPDEIFIGETGRYGFVDMEELKSAERRVLLRESDIDAILNSMESISNAVTVKMIVEGQKGQNLTDDWHVFLPNSDLNSEKENYYFHLIPFRIKSQEMEKEENATVRKLSLQTGNAMLAKRLTTLQKGSVRMVAETKQEPDHTMVTFTHKSRKFVPPIEEGNRILKEKYFDGRYCVADSHYPLPSGRYRNTDRYRSFQNLLPSLYKMNLPVDKNNGSESDKVNQLQLKGYLTFFDQFMADYLKQLGNLDKYFNIKESDEVEEMYQFHDLTEQSDITDVERVLNKENSESYKEPLQGEEYKLEHRNRMMDHLLARLNDSFDEYAPLIDMNYNDRFDGKKYLEESINDKVRLLKTYPEYSHKRSLAIGKTDKLVVTGAEHRILSKLGINNHKAKISPYLTGELQGDYNAGEEFSMSNEFENKFGIHILEHKMLVPYAGFSGKAFLEMTAIEPEYDEKGHKFYRAIHDPYSFYVTVLYPGELKIFQEEDFRDHVRKVIRDELPAHIDAIILGIKNDQMKKFEDAYEDLLDHLAHPNRSRYWLKRQLELIVRIKAILLGLKDVNEDGNNVVPGIPEPQRPSSQSSWKGIAIPDMLQSISRDEKLRVKCELTLEKRKKMELLKLITKE